MFSKPGVGRPRVIISFWGFKHHIAHIYISSSWLNSVYSQTEAERSCKKPDAESFFPKVFSLYGRHFMLIYSIKAPKGSIHINVIKSFIFLKLQSFCTACHLLSEMLCLSACLFKTHLTEITKAVKVAYKRWQTQKHYTTTEAGKLLVWGENFSLFQCTWDSVYRICDIPPQRQATNVIKYIAITALLKQSGHIASEGTRVLLFRLRDGCRLHFYTSFAVWKHSC